jgi:DNA-binding CsgD family transcriptional regulator
MANEVSNLLVHLLLAVRRQGRLPSGRLFQGLHFQAEDLVNPHARIDWEELTILLDQTLEEFGNPALFEQTMAETPRLLISGETYRGLFPDLQTFYLWLASIFTRRIHTNLQTTVRMDERGRMILEHHIPRPYRSSRALAIASEGFFRGAAHVLGFPDAHVEATFDERCGMYRITLPTAESAPETLFDRMPPRPRLARPWKTEIESSARFVQVGSALLHAASLQEIGIKLGDALQIFAGCSTGVLWICKGNGEIERIHTWGSRMLSLDSNMLALGTRILGRIDLDPLDSMEPSQKQALQELLGWACHAIERVQIEASCVHVDRGLTRREKQVMDLLSRGLSDKEIGLALGTSPKTVGHQVGSLLRKCGAENRTILAIQGLQS